MYGTGRVKLVSTSKNCKLLLLNKTDICLNIISSLMYSKMPPSGNYLFKVNNINTRTMCEICSKLTIKTLLLTLNRFHTLFECFYC